jgi:hypothetical protein
MFYRFKVVTSEGDSAETSFTSWREEQPLSTQAEADKVDEINKLRAANPDAAISIERSQVKPEGDEGNG